jgi:hypothetical protein
MLDLYHASRDEVIRLLLAARDARQEAEARVARQAVEIAQVRQAVAMLTERMGTMTMGDRDDPPPSSGASHAMPGHHPEQALGREVRPRKRRVHGAGRARMTATAHVDHGPAACPAGGAPLAGGTSKRTREVIDLPPPRIEVTEHRRCPDCGKRCVAAPDLGSVVTGQRRLGHGLTSLRALLRVACPHDPDGAEDRGGPVPARGRQPAPGGAAKPLVTAICETIRASPVVHLDETGWREAGHNGYVWRASTPDARLFVHGRRTKAMVGTILGDQFAGVVVRDVCVA